MNLHIFCDHRHNIFFLYNFVTQCLLGKHCFSVAALLVWNSLPLDLRTANSLPVFKNKLKTFFFRRDFKQPMPPSASDYRSQYLILALQKFYYQYYQYQYFCAIWMCRRQHVLCRGITCANGATAQYAVCTPAVCRATLVLVQTTHGLSGST